MVLFIECLNEDIVLKLEKYNLNNTGFEIKKEIKKVEHIPLDEQKLYYNFEEIKDNDIISKHIDNNSKIITLIIVEKNMTIKLKTMLNKEIIIKNITSQTLIEEIFLILFYFYDIHPDDITLIYKEKQLEKSRKLSYYDFVNNDTINIIIKIKSGF